MSEKESVQSRLEKMRLRALEFAQCRSSFQIEKFIGCDEYTPATRFRHLSHNSYMTLKSAKDSIVEQERLTRALKRLEKKENSVWRKIKIFFGYDDDLDLDKAKLSERLEELDIVIKGALKEVDIFESLCDQLEKNNGGPFTATQLEIEEPIHWQLRLAAQAHQTLLSRSTGVDIGNITAMIQASESPILSGSINKTTAFSLGTPRAELQ